MRRRLLCCLTMFVSFAGFSMPGISQESQKEATATHSWELPDNDEVFEGEGPIRRYDWFKNLWKDRRSQWARQKDGDQKSVVFFGDSITQGWGDQFQNLFPGGKLANRGISGDTTRGMLFRLDEDVLSLNPSGVVMLMGTNDLEEKASPDAIANNIKRIVTKIHAKNPKTPIVLCLVFPASESKARPADQIRKINVLAQKGVQDDPYVTVVDTWTLFANDAGDAKPEEFPDLLHPNATGYQKWAKALIPVLETLDLIPLSAEQIDAPAQNAPGGNSTMLFNGKDLSGWCVLPTSPGERRNRDNWISKDPNAPAWPVFDQLIDLDGKASTPDGRYIAHGGRIVVVTPSEGRRIQTLTTKESFPGDFVLRLQFRATPNADSGVFIRGKQLQCRDYGLAGPYKSLKEYRPQEWNQLEIRVSGNTAKCTCNGEVLEEKMELPETGPIGLEGDKGQVEYRNIVIYR